MTSQEVSETVARLKREFHSMMNGVASGSMRDKGLNYGVNFGVEGVRLVEMSHTLPRESALARALWQQKSERMQTACAYDISRRGIFARRL